MTDRTPWIDVPKPTRDQLVNKLTPLELHTYVLWLAGWGYRRIAAHEHVAVSTIVDRVRRAKRAHHEIDQEAA